MLEHEVMNWLYLEWAGGLRTVFLWLELTRVAKMVMMGCEDSLSVFVH